MKIDRNEVVRLLERLSNAKGPSGFEDEVIDVVRDFCDGWATVEENTLRDGLIVPNGVGLDGDRARPRVMMDAHGDEVGGMVRTIRANGTMGFVTLGRFPEGALCGQDVLVRNARGEWLHGTIGVKPPHFTSAAEKAAHVLPEMILDVGATSAEEARERFFLRIGEPFVVATQFTFDAERGIAVGKAFDCRAGVAAMLIALRELASRDDLSVDVVASVSAQEEVGERGVAAAARMLDPDVAYMFEGCPADDTCVEAYMVQTAIKKGPMLRHVDARMITNPRYQRYALALAGELGIPVQDAVRSGGSTNGANIHLSGKGVPTIVIGVPVRYAHTHYGISAYADYENGVKLAVEIIKRLNADVIGSF